MSRWKQFASALMACVVAVGYLGIAPAANAEAAGPPFLKSEKSVVEIKHRGRGPRIHLPIGPAYIYYDYPYYYSRGYYPTHIGGYVYYPQYYYRSYYWGYNRGSRSPRRQKGA
jgi:hypothetical protein